MAYEICSICLGCIILMMSSTDAVYPSSYIIKVKDILQSYTGIRIGSAVLLDSPNDMFENNHLTDMFVTYATSSRSTDLYLHQTPFFGNATRTAGLFLEKYYWPSLMIVTELALTSSWPVDLSNIHFQDMTNKIWLIVLSSKFDHQEDLDEAMNYKFTSLHRYLLQHLINSQIYVMVRLSRMVQLLEIYQVCPNKPYVIEKLATLSENESSDVQMYIWRNRINLQQCPIRVGCTFHPRLAQWVTPTECPSVTDGKTSNSSMIKPISETDITAFHMLSSKLNFSIEWVPVGKDYFSGSFDNNSRAWNGIIGMLERGEIDSWIGDLSITKERSNVIKFAVPHISFHYSLFMKRHKPTSSWNTFLNVLSISYWNVIGFSLIIFTMSLSYYSMKISNIQHLTNVGMVLSKMIVCFCTAAKAFLALDVTNTAARVSNRMLLIVMCMCGVLNYYVYNAGLISNLMVENSEIPIQTLKDFQEKPEYQLLVIKYSSGYDYFKMARPLTIEKKLWEEKRIQDISNYKEGEQLALENDKMVLFATFQVFAHQFKSYPCSITASNGIYNREFAAYAFNKDTQYLQAFNYHMSRLIQNGVTTRNDVYTFQKIAKVCNEGERNVFRSFGAHDMVLVFFILLIGCMISLVYLAFEYIYVTRLSSSKVLSPINKEMLKKELQKVRQLQNSTNECARKIETTLLEHLHKHHREEDFSNIFHICHEGYNDKFLHAQQAISNLLQFVEASNEDPRIMNSAVANYGGYENIIGQTQHTISTN